MNAQFLVNRFNSYEWIVYVSVVTFYSYNDRNAKAVFFFFLNSCTLCKHSLVRILRLMKNVFENSIQAWRQLIPKAFRKKIPTTIKKKKKNIHYPYQCTRPDISPTHSTAFSKKRRKKKGGGRWSRKIFVPPVARLSHNKYAHANSKRRIHIR